MLLPVACGSSNRADYVAIWQSILAQKGSALTKDVGSISWIEASTYALGPYSIWCYNAKLANQFGPQTMSDFLPRWEAIFNLQPLPADDLQTRRNKIQARYSILNIMPTLTALDDLFTLSLPQTFVDVLDTKPTSAKAGYAITPGSSTPGPAVTGGPSSILSANWFSTVADIFVELHKPPSMSLLQFYQQNAYQVYPLLTNYLPVTVAFDWLWNSFNISDGAGHASTITVSAGSAGVVGTNCTWIIAVNSARGSFPVASGDILEAFDDNGVWHRLTVSVVVSNGVLVLTAVAPANFTNQPYWIQGFFADCSPTAYPYSLNSYNVDNSGII